MQQLKFTELNPCIHRKGTTIGSGEHVRIILACNGFEVTVKECSICSGKPKTRMTFRQFLNQKEQGLKTILRRKMRMETMTNDEIVDRLNIIYNRDQEPELGKIYIVLGLLLILLSAITLMYMISG